MPGKKKLSPWSYPAAAAAAGAPADAASAVCIDYIVLGGTLRAPVEVHDKMHTASAAAPAAAYG